MITILADISAFVPIAQILTPIVLGVSAMGILRQIKIQRNLNRRQHYWTASVLTNGYVESVKLHWRDHFAEKYDAEYAADETKLKSYLLMKQKYMYLLFQHCFEDEFTEASRVWLSEVIKYREFRHVHRSHARYYPKFAEAVDKLIGNSKDELTEWMSDTFPKSENKLGQADGMPDSSTPAEGKTPV